MGDRVRTKNGRFAKRKVIEKKEKFLVAMADARRRIKENKKLISERNFTFEGNRIVNLKELAANLICFKCREALNLNNIISETREGLSSYLEIVCIKCGTRNQVSTGNRIQSRGQSFSEVNLGAVLGAVNSDIGYTGLQKILSSLDIPGIPTDLYKYYELEVKAAILAAAKDNSQKADEGETEKQLVVENFQDLYNNQ